MQAPTSEILNLTDHGAQHFAGAALDILEPLLAEAGRLPQDRAGVRVTGMKALGSLLAASGPLGRVAARWLGPECRPVRMILFDKNPASNWALGWHQDRTICVKRRLEIDGFGPWTVKAGLTHVQPPFDLLSRMITLRVHLDDVGEDNAPLLIAPGTHRIRASEARMEAIVRESGTVSCLARAGDVWAYSTPILHASKAATFPSRRRVLQLDYSAADLPGGLEWQGV